MSRTIEIAQAALARHQLASYPPDLLIEVPRSACRSLDFIAPTKSSISATGGGPRAGYVRASGSHRTT